MKTKKILLTLLCVGAVLGIAGGAALGITGGIQDVKWLLQQQKEARSYAVDMYNFNLGNIQALPYSLTKTGTLTRNNKLFPVLEYYSCTDEEKDAIKEQMETLKKQYTFIEMEENDLRRKIESMMDGCKKKVSKIQIYNESKKSTSKNAFLLKLLWIREFGIADNFMNENSENELLAVLAHEIGHYRKGHIIKMIITLIIQ